MAKAKFADRWVHRDRVVHVHEVTHRTGFNLFISDGEADFLLAVLSAVGGSPTKSPRKYAERISAALEKATSLKYVDTDAFPLMKVIGGQVQFKDYPDPDAGFSHSNNEAWEEW